MSDILTPRILILTLGVELLLRQPHGRGKARINDMLAMLVFSLQLNQRLRAARAVLIPEGAELLASQRGHAVFLVVLESLERVAVLAASLRVGEEVAQVAAAALAEAVGVVGWRGVGDGAACADVGEAEFVGLCVVSAVLGVGDWVGVRIAGAVGWICLCLCAGRSSALAVRCLGAGRAIAGRSRRSRVR